MRILVLHSRYLSGGVSGENRVVDDETKLLREAGHQVWLWDPTPTTTSGLQLLRVGVKTIWSTSAVTKVRELIRQTRADIVHCHNLFPELSPAVLREASSQAAVVMTLHNFRSLCLPATFVRDGRVCEDCLGRLPWPGVVHGCYRGSKAGSAVLASSLALHRTLGTFDRTTLYFAVSEFIKQKHVQAGWAHDRISVKSNFAWPSRRREGSGEYFLYLGRLSAEKGISTLLEAFEELPAPLIVVGDGPQADELRAMTSSPSIHFRGAVSPSEVDSLLRRARALLVPSIWYEGQPRGILEAYAAGVPVVASDIGGLPEAVVDGVTGFLVPAGNPKPWMRAVERLLEDAEAERLADGAWLRWHERYTPEQGLEGLESAYERALERQYLNAADNSPTI
jgi:glycosyltransferase involved in cell wall biosynthesis